MKTDDDNQTISHKRQHWKAKKGRGDDERREQQAKAPILYFWANSWNGRGKETKQREKEARERGQCPTKERTKAKRTEARERLLTDEGKREGKAKQKRNTKNTD